MAVLLTLERKQLSATQKEVREQERRVRPLLKKWIKIMGLQNWDLSIELDPGIIDPGDKALAFGAECEPNYEYESATIRFSVPEIATYTDEGLETLIIHELQHCLLDEAKIKNTDSEEHVATLLTKAFMRATCLI